MGVIHRVVYTLNEVWHGIKWLKVTIMRTRNVITTHCLTVWRGVDSRCNPISILYRLIRMLSKDNFILHSILCVEERSSNCRVRGRFGTVRSNDIHHKQQVKEAQLFTTSEKNRNELSRTISFSSTEVLTACVWRDWLLSLFLLLLLLLSPFSVLFFLTKN